MQVQVSRESFVASLEGVVGFRTLKRGLGVKATAGSAGTSRLPRLHEMGFRGCFAQASPQELSNLQEK